PFLAAPIPPPADSEHICSHVAPIGLFQHSEAQEDAIAQWRSAVYSAPSHWTPADPLQRGFPPDSVPRAVGWPLSNSSRHGTCLRTAWPGERQASRLSRTPPHDPDYPRKDLHSGTSTPLMFTTLLQGAAPL